MKVRLTVTESNCRCRCMNAGDTFEIDDLCPPICHELWNTVYPSVFVLKNGGLLDHGDERVPYFDAACPDGERVRVHGERID